MFLHIVLLILSVNVQLYSSTSSIQPDVIGADALLISKLARQIKELSPPVVRQFLEASCRMATDCCGRNSTNSTAILSLFNITTFLDECFGEIHSLDYEERVQSCTPLLNMTQLAGDKQLKQVMFLTTMKNSDEIKSIGQICSKEEIHSVLCDWNDFDRQQACRLKLMKHWADEHDEKTYEGKVQQLKEDYNRIIEELRKQKSQ